MAKSQRRAPPAAPANLDKVISGELKGEDLYKFNAAALQDWNDAALLPCEFCKRTFLPTSLAAHQKMCTEDNPMVKHNKEESYTSKAKAKVNYPKFKGKGKEKNEEDNEEDTAEDDKPSRPKTYTVTKSSDDTSNPSRNDIVKMIKNSEVLESPDLRFQLFDLVEQFLKENAAEE